MTVSGFEGVTSLQFTIEWNPADAQFVRVSGATLPGLDTDNFGTALVSDGKLTFSWDDPRAKGVTLADGTTILTVELKSTNPKAQPLVLSFSDQPTLREVGVGTGIAQLITEDGPEQIDSSSQSALALRVRIDRETRRVRLEFQTKAGETYAVESIDEPQPVVIPVL